MCGTDRRECSGCLEPLWWSYWGSVELTWNRIKLHRIKQLDRPATVLSHFTRRYLIWSTLTRGPLATSLTWETSSNQWIHLSKVRIIYIIKLAQQFRRKWFLNFMNILLQFCYYNVSPNTRGPWATSLTWENSSNHKQI